MLGDNLYWESNGPTDHGLFAKDGTVLVSIKTDPVDPNRFIITGTAITSKALVNLPNDADIAAIKNNIKERVVAWATINI